MVDPTTPAQWKVAVAMAEACLVLESARMYGLVTGGPKVAVDRCTSIVARGHALGYVPTQAEIDEAVIVLVSGG